MQIITDIIPTKVRKISYFVYAMIGVALGAVQAAVLAISIPSPQWLTVGLAVFAYIGVAFGLVAARNTVQPTATIADRNTAAHAPQPDARG